MFNATELCYRINEHIIFKGVSLDIRPGELMQVVGRNGCGKSSLLKIISGIISPSEGVCYWRGEPVQNDMARFFEHSAYVGHVSGLKEELTLAQNLKIYANLWGEGFNIYDLQDNKQRVMKMLQQLKLISLLQKPVKFLSQGQRRKASIACAFVKKPKLLILDEPFAAVDSPGREAIYELLINFMSKGGMVIKSVHERVKEYPQVPDTKLKTLLLEYQ